MKRLLIAALAGALFGVGLALSRMTDPNVVIGFLDVFGRFDPTLAFVLAGAVGMSVLGFRGILARPAPLCEPAFSLPRNHAIDRSLVLGAALFGIGWGLAGYCPGPAVVGFAAGVRSAWIFVPAMLVGAWLQGVLARWLERRGGRA